jgi:hypothetical protein
VCKLSAALALNIDVFAAEPVPDTEYAANKLLVAVVCKEHCKATKEFI